MTWAVDSTFDGHCIPAAYIGGIDGATAPSQDLCWTASGTDITTADFPSAPATWLDTRINGCKKNTNPAIGYAVCDTDYEAIGDVAGALNGTC